MLGYIANWKLILYTLIYQRKWHMTQSIVKHSSFKKKVGNTCTLKIIGHWRKKLKK